MQIVLKLIIQEERELEVKFISRATSVWETGCIVFIKEQRTGKSVRKFCVNFWEDLFLKIVKITSSVKQDLKSDKRIRAKLWHNSNADVCVKTVHHEFQRIRLIFRRIPCLHSKDSRCRSCNSTNSQLHSQFFCWKKRFKN